jgi:hypothetical protein
VAHGAGGARRGDRGGTGGAGAERSDTATRWPYLVVGVCFGLYGLALFAYGSHRRRGVERALDEGRFPKPLPYAHEALVAGGIILGLLTVALVVAG